MARGRMLDRSIKLSKKIASTSMAGQWLYFRMLPFTDDHGKTHGDPEDIKAEILPKEKISEDKISSLLQELHDNDLILWANGYVCEFVDWCEHQTLKGRPSNSQFPDYQEVMGKGQKRLEKVGKESDETDSLSSLPLSSPSLKKGGSRGKKSIPTIEEAQAYFLERKSTFIEANKFYDYYQSIGWVVGKAKNPMKDWQASARGWISRAESGGKKIDVYKNPGEDQYKDL